MNGFKVGDKVRCIDDSASLNPMKLLKNDIYTVSEPGKYIIILEETRSCGWRPERFELAHIKEFSDKLRELVK